MKLGMGVRWIWRWIRRIREGGGLRNGLGELECSSGMVRDVYKEKGCSYDM